MVPLALPDLERFQILRASIAQFWECEGAIYVIVRDQDEAAIAAVVGDDDRYQVLRETTIAPFLAECGPGNGWYKQQLIKLAFAAFTPNDFYLTLDADCFLIERVKGLTPTGQWERLLLERPGWTENTLYHVNAEDRELWQAFHYQGPHAIHGNCIWNLEDARDWDASRSFQAPSFMFSVVQSNTGLPASWTWERVKPYLGGAA